MSLNVHGKAAYMLSCNAIIHGPFDGLWDAKARHAILAPSASSADGTHEAADVQCN